MKALPKKYFSKYKKPLVPFPDLLKVQIDSYQWLLDKGIQEIFQEFSPIYDYSKEKFKLEFSSFTLDNPKFDEYYAKENKITYESKLKAKIKLHNKTLKTVKEQELLLVNIPLMTSHGTFIINGVERVVVPQLSRSFGIFFTENEVKGKIFFGAKIVPARGAWIEIESDIDGILYVRIDRKRKFLITLFLRILGLSTDKEIIAAFKGNEVHKKMIEECLKKDQAKDTANSYVEIYSRLRDGELATPDNAKEFIDDILSSARYDLSEVGRYRFNQRFEKDMGEEEMARRTLSKDDLVTVVAHIFDLNTTPGSAADDIDHLGHRRIRAVGELLQHKFRVGMTQMRRNIQDRMSIIDAETALPVNIINQRPLQARISEFFSQSQLSQFMSQENVLYEIEHLRTLSALGPGGLTRERAGLEVRDVHTSHYGRVCPIQTPEGPNIGLILHMATYARVNRFGIIETPYVKVKNGRITSEVVYMNALEEEKYNIAHGGIPYDDKGYITTKRVEVRSKTKPGLADRSEVDFIDVATNQAFSIATSLIPFLEHDDANRALMGSNMQKQATPCLTPQAPLVATGMEERAARYSGRLVIAGQSGTVSYVDAKLIKIKDREGKEHQYSLKIFPRNNNNSTLHQRPIINLGSKVKKGDILADASSTDQGQVAIGQNILAAFMCWGGSNYEDAIIVSERLVKNSQLTSLRIEEYECVVRDTKLGPEVTTRDIPNVGELKLKDLDAEGIVRVGAGVRENDILVGKITPKGETELTPEERLLRSIFAEKARDVKDTSRRIGVGKRGRVVNIKIFSRDQGHNLESGVLKKVLIEVAQIRNVAVGDKLAGRHGNKGVISTILPEEDMPYMADGTPIDIILTPLGVPSRMNLGQVFEMHLGMAAHALGYQAIIPPFSGATEDEIKKELKEAGFEEDGKFTLYDGLTGEPFENNIAVGYMYMIKLHHMVEDKIHMRSIGPYSLITQQPLGGKAQGGGQRFGEMEVWALEGYGAAASLREMLTIKSDDVIGRSQAFDSIIKGEKIKTPHAPASFSVLINYLRGLALDVQLIKERTE